MSNRLEQKIYKLAGIVTKLEPHVEIRYTPCGSQVGVWLFRGHDLLPPRIVVENIDAMPVKQILKQMQQQLEEWNEATESTT